LLRVLFIWWETSGDIGFRAAPAAHRACPQLTDRIYLAAPS
jgi:hypothetical protein